MARPTLSSKIQAKVLRVAAAESGNNKYSDDPQWSAMGRSLSAAVSWPVTSAPFVARNSGEDATRRHLPCSNLPLNHFNFKQIDITLPVPPSCRAARLPALPSTRSITQSSGRNWKYCPRLSMSLSHSLSLSVFVRTSGNSITINVDGNDESNAKLGRSCRCCCCCCFCFIHFPFPSPCPRWHHRFRLGHGAVAR